MSNMQNTATDRVALPAGCGNEWVLQCPTTPSASTGTKMPAPSSNSATSSTGSDGARGKGNSATSSTGRDCPAIEKLVIVFGVVSGVALLLLVAGIMFFVCRNRSKDQMGARKMVDESVSVAIELRTNPTKPKLKKLKKMLAEQLTNTEDYEMEKKEIIDVILCIDKEMLRRKSMSGELGSDVSPNVRSPAKSLHVTASLSKFKPGNEQCTECNAGQYSSETGVTQCKDCCAHTYSEETGATSSTTCKDCPNGWNTPSVGSTTCTFSYCCQAKIAYPDYKQVCLNVTSQTICLDSSSGGGGFGKVCNWDCGECDATKDFPQYEKYCNQHDNIKSCSLGNATCEWVPSYTN